MSCFGCISSRKNVSFSLKINGTFNETVTSTAYLSCIRLYVLIYKGMCGKLTQINHRATRCTFFVSTFKNSLLGERHLEWVDSFVSRTRIHLPRFFSSQSYIHMYKASTRAMHEEGKIYQLEAMYVHVLSFWPYFQATFFVSSSCWRQKMRVVLGVSPHSGLLPHLSFQ